MKYFSQIVPPAPPKWRSSECCPRRGVSKRFWSQHAPLAFEFPKQEQALRGLAGRAQLLQHRLEGKELLSYEGKQRRERKPDAETQSADEEL